MPLSDEDCIFFWQISGANGWASQWYHSPFEARIQIQVDSGVSVDSQQAFEFPTAEHWMMACKALVFSDKEIFYQILEADASDMRSVKALGRLVKGFDDKVWKDVREQIVLSGNLHKFRQHEDLRNLLLDTGEKVIVEASPRDRIWGIGFGEKRALTEKSRWGLNLLGQALMHVRRILRAEVAE